ncbi:MafI family immunity protein [Camelimonas sp. ID_303_24]
MNNSSIRIIEFITSFKNRICNEIILMSIDYVEHGEAALGMETLCDGLADSDFSLSEAEIVNLINFLYTTKADFRKNALSHLILTMKSN